MVRLSGPDALALHLRPKQEVVEATRRDAGGPDAQSPPKSTRFVALDAFRGAVILLMLVVNNAALDTATPVQLTHAGWNLGLHLADMVLPWFLFCVGASIPFSAGNYRERRHWRFRYLGRIATRSAILVILGMGVDCAVNKRLDVSLGVLQLIGLAYFVAAITYEGPVWLRPVVAALLMGGYAAALMNMSFPGGAPGVFEENRNLMHFVNTQYLAPYKMDGLFDALPTAGLVLFGTMIGDVLRKDGWRQPAKLAVVALSGWVFLLAGDVLSVYVPFNKPVCSPSYLMVAGGSGAMALAIFLLLFDLLKLKNLALPLVVFGANAIAAYVLPILIKVMVLQVWVVATPKGNLDLQHAFLNWLRLNYGLIQGGWTYTATYIGVWWIVLALLYRKRLFFRV